jgi:hypothetical protein
VNFGVSIVWLDTIFDFLGVVYSIMIRRPNNRAAMTCGVNRGGFDTAAPLSVAPAQVGRGVALEQTSQKGYVAPLTAEETSKPRKNKKTGMFEITKKTKIPKSDKAGPIDEMGVINWEMLDKERKHAPCVKLLKQLKKGKVSEK